MHTFPNGTCLVEAVSELPDLRNARSLYADYETTSGDDKVSSVNPWRSCWVAGVGVTVDDEQGAWYVPVNHRHGVNLPQEPVIEWWRALLDAVHSKSGAWINHAVKYDAHVSANCWGVLPECELHDTLTWAKLIDSDRQRKGGYGLDALSRDWLHEDISAYELALKPYLANSKDYGRVPPDVMAPYCGQDVITGRRLSKWIRANTPESCHGVRQTETDLTTVLFHVERHGMRVSPKELQITELQIWGDLMRLDRELTELVGRSFRPDVNEDCFDVICNQFGMPVVAWTEEGEDEETGEKAGNPSFDKHALAQYLSDPYAPHEVIKRIIAYRKHNTLKNFFVKRYQEVAIPVEGSGGQAAMHPTYNQCVRTGRMSCKDPNAQQLDKPAKSLIHPPPGRSLVSIDDAQIEFRLLAGAYVMDPYVLQAYKDDPDTDFHNWVAEMIQVKRKPAKTINFLMAFGGGKEKLLKGLESNLDLVGDLKLEVEAMIAKDEIKKEQEKEVFKMLARRRAEAAYTRYHETLPGIKRTSRDVAKVCEARGYVFNLAGRRRHLPSDKAHIAFNTLNQSLAADLMKKRMVKLFKYLKERKLLGTIDIMAQVHDELVLDMPTEIADDPRTKLGLVAFMETEPTGLLRPLGVPLRCALGTSAANWKEACSDENAKAIKYDRVEVIRSGLHEDPMRHVVR